MMQKILNDSPSFEVHYLKFSLRNDQKLGVNKWLKLLVFTVFSLSKQLI